MGRTDLHKPSTAEYGDYEYLCSFLLGSVSEEYADFLSEMFANDAHTHEEVLEKYKTFAGNFDRKETCDHCGTRFKYGCCYLHKPSGELVHVGHTCANKSFSYTSRHEYDKKRLAEKAKTARQAVKFLSANPGLYEALQVDHYRVKELRSNLQRYGRLYPADVTKVLQIAEERAELLAGNASEVPVTEDRVALTGTILAFKVKRSYHGETLKMLVKHSDGYKLWGTCPAKLNNCERGDTVQFTAKVEQSKDDPYFGFYSRPTKASVVAKAAEEAA